MVVYPLEFPCNPVMLPHPQSMQKNQPVIFIYSCVTCSTNILYKKCLYISELQLIQRKIPDFKHLRLFDDLQSCTSGLLGSISSLDLDSKLFNLPVTKKCQVISENACFCSFCTKSYFWNLPFLKDLSLDTSSSEEP